MNAKGQEGGNEDRKELGEYMRVSYKGSLIASPQCGLHFRKHGVYRTLLIATSFCCAQRIHLIFLMLLCYWQDIQREVSFGYSTPELCTLNFAT